MSVQQQALKLLQSPYFFREALRAVRRNGLVGEERNALVVFLVAISRLFTKPLCLFVKGPSGVGKNLLVDTVLALLPESAVLSLTSSSPRAFNYLGESAAHKVLYLKERNEGSGSFLPTRLLVSEKELVHWITVREDGHFVQKPQVTKGPIASISTTTRDRVEVDDETRHVSIWLDESPEQTAKIMAAALDPDTKLGQEELDVWHSVQTLLEKRASIPIEFPTWFREIAQFTHHENLWARRYFPAFLQSCRTVALVRSFALKQQGKPGKITVRFTDFAITALIFNPVFESSMDRADDRDLEVQQHVRLISSQNGGTGVSAAELAKHTGISIDSAYAELRKAASAGTIFRTNKPSKGNRKLYLPAKPRPFLPDPAEVFQRLEGLPKRVEFAHPLTGKRIVYERLSKAPL